MNYEDHELLGFDIRFDPRAFVQTIWDKKRRQIHLLKSDIQYPLSIDTMVWPSFFRYSSNRSEPFYFQSEEILTVIPKSFRHSALELWPSLDDMIAFFKDKKEKIATGGVLIAATLLREKHLRTDDFWNAVLEPKLNREPFPKDWDFLGYDIADNGFISGLSNCGYNPSEKNILKEIWSDRLNEYGLLKNVSDAIEFRNLSNKRIPEHSPFYIYGLLKKR